MDVENQDQDPAAEVVAAAIAVAESINENRSEHFNSDESIPLEAVVEQLKNIAETGNTNIEWLELQRALKVRLSNVLNHYMEKNPDFKEQYQEPNVEKFDLQTSRDEILELIESFNEAPFTIQRICELLHSPTTYYDRISTFLRGLEKNLRVISPNESVVASASSCNTGSKIGAQEEPTQPSAPPPPDNVAGPTAS